MSDAQPSSTKHWSYRFTKPGGVEVETKDLDGDGSAERHARELSTSSDSPIVVHRHSPLVDDWEYVIEVDDRP